MPEPTAASFNDMWADRVAFAFPSSAAMDVAAGGGGPSATALPQVVTGNAPAVDNHAAQLTQLLTRLVGLLQDLERAKNQLRQVWPAGSAADQTQNKLGTSFGSYDQVIQSGYTFVRELQGAAAQVKAAQTGYSSVVSTVNPTVAALWSTQYGKPAATALSTTTTGTLNSFLTTIGGLLKTIGTSNIASIVSGLAQIAGGLQKLLSSGTAMSSAATLPPVPAALSTAPLTVAPPVSPVSTTPPPVPAAPNTNTPNTNTSNNNTWIPV